MSSVVAGVVAVTVAVAAVLGLEASSQERATPAPAASVVPAQEVLDPLSEQAPTPSPRIVRQRMTLLASAAALGDDVTWDVVDVATGERIAAAGPGTAQVAASTLKLLTGAAALSVLGADATLPTRVVAGPTPEEVVLVGGGDVLLAAGAGNPDAVNGHAGLADLARQTAATLRARGVGAVVVRLDDSLFTGPTVSRSWGPFDVRSGFVAPITALQVDAGRAGPGRYPRRAADPSLVAAQAFTARLAAEGIAVTGPVARARAPRRAALLGEVRGAALGDVVEYALTYSDNTVAEALARLVARAKGRPGTFADAGVAVLDQIAELGIPIDGASLSGGSGLGRTDRAPAATLTGVLRSAAGSAHGELRALLSGLPVAAGTGTLATRFTGPAERAARGVVRAKTGSLNGVNSLAGVVVDADGRLLAFAVLADRTGAADPARAALDRMGVLLAGCGCR